jgi:hypothetical protein
MHGAQQRRGKDEQRRVKLLETLDGEPIQNESYNPNSTLHSKIFSPNFRGDPHPYLPNNA